MLIGITDKIRARTSFGINGKVDDPELLTSEFFTHQHAADFTSSGK
jgi:hypothetical protein